MDDQLAQLRAIVNADPQNHDARLQYLRALRKAGLTEEFERFVGMEVLCQKRFSELAETNQPGERYCDQCERTVHYAFNVEQLKEKVSRGHCISTHLHVLSGWVEQVSAHDPESLDVDGPCLVPAEAPWMDLTDFEPPEELCQNITIANAHALQFLPVTRLDTGRILVVVARLPDPGTARHIRHVLGAGVRWALTDDTQLQAAISKRFPIDFNEFDTTTGLIMEI